MPHVSDAAPAILDRRRVRSAVGEFQHRISFCGIKVGRLDHHRFHLKAVAGLHLQQLACTELVLLQCVYLVFGDDAHEFAINVVEARLRWRVYIAPVVYEKFGVEG